jgi:RHS repeat-associated protein
VQWDDAFGLGLTYMHARTYSPTLGRFLQPDPSRLDAQLFVYAANSPVSRVDPSGLATWYLRAQRIVNVTEQWRYAAGLAGAFACSPFGPTGSIACFNVGYVSQKVWGTQNDAHEVRTSYYSTSGQARIEYRGAVRSYNGAWRFASATSGATYTSGSMAIAKACAEVLIGIRDAYNLEWFCGRPTGTWG